jgi:hypothetical protein
VLQLACHFKAIETSVLASGRRMFFKTDVDQLLIYQPFVSLELINALAAAWSVI